MTNYDIETFIANIEHAAHTYTSYKEIADEARIRVETLWKIRNRKTVPNMRTARDIAVALDKLKNK